MANGTRTTATLTALDTNIGNVAYALPFGLGTVSVPGSLLAAAGVAAGGGSLTPGQAAAATQNQVNTNLSKLGVIPPSPQPTPPGSDFTSQVGVQIVAGLAVAIVIYLLFGSK